MTAKKKTTKKKAKKTQVTRVALVVDRSGSMGTIRSEALEGINSQLHVLRENADLGGDTFVTYVQFDNVIESLYQNKKASDVKNLDYNDYVPRGGTAWRDAVFTAIQKLEEGVEDTEDTAYLVVVVSDGEENASSEISQKQLQDLIEEKTKTGRWTFTYMLANVDALKVARESSVSYGNTLSFTSSVGGTKGAFAQMANSTANYMSLRSSGVRSVNSFYSQDSQTPAVGVTVDSTGGINVAPNSNLSGVSLNISTPTATLTSKPTK
jgi:uncharacterized protein YegL